MDISVDNLCKEIMEEVVRKNRVECVVRMLEQNISVNKIAEYSGLTVEEICIIDRNLCCYAHKM